MVRACVSSKRGGAAGSPVASSSSLSTSLLVAATASQAFQPPSQASMILLNRGRGDETPFKLQVVAPVGDKGTIYMTPSTVEVSLVEKTVEEFNARGNDGDSERVTMAVKREGGLAGFFCQQGREHAVVLQEVDSFAAAAAQGADSRSINIMSTVSPDSALNNAATKAVEQAEISNDLLFALTTSGSKGERHVYAVADKVTKFVASDGRNQPTTYHGEVAFAHQPAAAA